MFLAEYPVALTNCYAEDYFVKADKNEHATGYQDYVGDVSPLSFTRNLALLEAARIALDMPREGLLEIGAATGDFLALAHLFGWDRTHAVEVSHTARTLARRLGVHATSETLGDLSPGATFEFATSWETIEHLPDPAAFVADVRAHLAPGGVFICSTPDAGQAGYYPRANEWIGFHVSLEHVTYFTARSLLRLLSSSFAHVEVWSSCTDTFYHQLFAVGLSDTPSPDSLERMRRLPGLTRLDPSPAFDPALIVPRALGGLHGSAESRAALRREYDTLKNSLEGMPDPAARLALALVATTIGDAATRDRSFQDFLRERPRTTVPASVVSALVPRKPRALPSQSRADRVADGLRAAATAVRSGRRRVRRGLRGLAYRRALPPARAELRTILDAHRDRKGVIIYPPYVVHSRIFQRPHQLGRVLAERGFLFFFCTPDPQMDEVARFRRLQHNLFLSGVPLEAFRQVEEPIIYLSRPAGWDEFCDRLTGGRGATLWYDWIDHLPVFGDAISQVEPHAELLGRAAIVSASASALYAEAKHVRPDVLLLPNAVRIEDFQGRSATDAVIPGTVQEARRTGRPIIGYYGSIAEWFDFDLFERVLALNRDKLFLAIGPNWKQPRWDEITRAVNLIHVDHVPYRDLGAFLQYFDVATVPFRVNSVTHATSPVKLFEYMAAGKPIVTTGFLESKQYRSVLWGQTPESFSEALTHALTLRHDPAYLAGLRAEALANTWEDRARAIDDALTSLHRTHARAERPFHLPRVRAEGP